MRTIGSTPRLRLGGWLFRHRGWLPAAPIAAMGLFGRPSGGTLVLGFTLAALAEGLRFWAARAIGPASRTRGSAPGALALAGPYRFCRNPLYIANIAIYGGFAIATGRWSALAFPLLAVPYYSLIVAWEEHTMERVHGETYLAFKERTARWVPGRPAPSVAVPLATWRQALRAERGSLVVFTAMAVALLARWGWSAL